MSLLIPQLPPNFDAALRDVTSKKEEFRFMAVKALASAPDGREHEAGEALLPCTLDVSLRVRQMSVIHLGLLRYPGAVQKLQERVDDSHADVRQAALIALSQVGQTCQAQGQDSRMERIRRTLTSALSDARADVRFLRSRSPSHG